MSMASDNDAEGCGFLVPVQMSVDGLWGEGVDEAYEFGLGAWLRCE